MKYAAEAQELTRPERNTLLVSFEDIERYNQQLATTVLEEYYRCFYLRQFYLCQCIPKMAVMTEKASVTFCG